MKSPAFRSKALRDSARGQCCTLQIPGICNSNPETTVLCHLPSLTHAWGLSQMTTGLYLGAQIVMMLLMGGYHMNGSPESVRKRYYWHCMQLLGSGWRSR